jgi:hypothetical protein
MRAAARLALALIAVAALTGVAPSPASAAEPFQCGPNDRWCNGTFIKHGQRFLDITGFEMQGRYRVCVTSPGARERCKAFTLVPNGTGANASSIRFTKHFPHARPGRYRVRWVYDGRQLGRTLTFKV